jgi:Zinc finger, C2H2 type.
MFDQFEQHLHLGEDLCCNPLSLLSPQAPPLLQCIFCFRQFHSASELQLHLHEHTAGPLQCPLCPKTFRVQFLLETHLTTHHPALVSPSTHLCAPSGGTCSEVTAMKKKAPFCV